MKFSKELPSLVLTEQGHSSSFRKNAKMGLFNPCVEFEFLGPNYFIWSGMKVPFPDSVMNWPINWLISTHSEERKKEYKLNNPPDLSAYPVENCIPKHAFEVEHVENRKKSNFTFLMHQNYSLNIMSLYRMSICITEFAALGENLNTEGSCLTLLLGPGKKPH